jgi:ATP-binding cassette subfamily B (MDR/TAP) protein 1
MSRNFIFNGRWCVLSIDHVTPFLRFHTNSVVFGDLIDAFSKWQAAPNVAISSEELLAKVNQNTVYFLYLALATFLATYLYMFAFVYTSERQTYRIRQEYLLAVLRQNMAWFDGIGAGEVATRISSDTLLIQDGIGEKIPLALTQTATFISGFVIAFTKNWKLTLVLLSVLPFVIISGAIMSIAFSFLMDSRHGQWAIPNTNFRHVFYCRNFC